MHMQTPSVFDRAMAMWRQIDFPSAPPASIAPYSSYLKGTYQNGEVVQVAFSMPDSDDFSDFVARGTLHDMYFFERFWRASNVSHALPYKPHDLNFLSVDLFNWISPVELPGSLASILVRGGAYGRNIPTARKALELGHAAAEALLAEDFETPQVFVSNVAWSSFFCDVAWDYSWVIVRPADRRIEVLLATDTD